MRIPSRFTITSIADLLSDHQHFLQRSLTIHATRHRWPIKEGSELYIFGRKLSVCLNAKATQLNLDSFHLKTRKTSLTQKEFYQAISAFLLPHITTSIQRNQKLMGIQKIGTVRLKLVKSQWGSCTNKGNLSFNKKLIHYPADCIEYVVVHELAHIFEHNHSKAFWNIVQKYWPNYKADRRVLKERKYG